jgi:hypothetical protein
LKNQQNRKKIDSGDGNFYQYGIKKWRYSSATTTERKHIDVSGFLAFGQSICAAAVGITKALPEDNRRWVDVLREELSRG